MKYLSCLAMIFLIGCASNKEVEVSNNVEQKPVVETAANDKARPPHLWSGHKVLNVNVAACASKGESILSILGFKHVVKNGHYVYGNFGDSRAAVKCLSVLDTTFVYVAVAGPEVKRVERLRNEIVWKL